MRCFKAVFAAQYLILFLGCGAVFTDEYLGFVSPGFPNGYAHNLICNYTIIGPPGRYIVLTFRGAIFDIEGLYYTVK